MTYLSDALRLLDEEAIALAFLPVINYIYVVSQYTDPGWLTYAIGGLTILVSAAVYNLYLNIDFPSSEPTQYGEFEIGEEGNVVKKGKGGVVGVWTTITAVFFTLLWVILFFCSLILLASLNSQSVWPIALIVASVLVVCLVITELAFSWRLSPYRGSNSSSGNPKTTRFVDEKTDTVIYVIQLPDKSEPVVKTVSCEDTELDLDDIDSLNENPTLE